MGHKLMIEMNDDLFGTVLDCAVRYALGRKSYMPGLVVDFITSIIPHLNNKTLWCLDQDLTEAKFTSSCGEPLVDEQKWMDFHSVVRKERERRGCALYKSWRENNETDRR